LLRTLTGSQKDTLRLRKRVQRFNKTYIKPGQITGKDDKTHRIFPNRAKVYSYLDQVFLVTGHDAFILDKLYNLPGREIQGSDIREQYKQNVMRILTDSSKRLSKSMVIKA